MARIAQTILLSVWCITASTAVPQLSFRGRVVGRDSERTSNIIQGSTGLDNSDLPKVGCGQNSCAPGYETFRGKCYKVHEGSRPYDQAAAQRLCQKDKAILAADKSPEIHGFLRTLLEKSYSKSIDSQHRRAFIGLSCDSSCDNPANWRYSDGSSCVDNSFCNWLSPRNQWNVSPADNFGPSVAALLDNFDETSYDYKIQPYPANNQLRYHICEKDPDSTEHLKPRAVRVSERVSWVTLSWERPHCDGDISNYILVLLGGGVTYDTEMKCNDDVCTHDLTPEGCNYCIRPNTDYTFSIAAALGDNQLGPAVTINKKIDVETCDNFETPVHTITLCRGVSEVISNGTCNNAIVWSKGSMCQAECEEGYGFYDKPSPKYSCETGGRWSPAPKAPMCYEIVPVFSANLQYKIIYQRESIDNLKHQFDGLVYKYNDIFCPYPEECGIAKLDMTKSINSENKPIVTVVMTIDSPVYNITDQVGFLEIVTEALGTVTEDNAFMTLIDYDNIELVLPSQLAVNTKAEPMLCCHTCPDGHAYRLGYCVRCPTPSCN